MERSQASGGWSLAARLLPALLAAVILTACGSGSQGVADTGGNGGEPGVTAPDFALLDVNPASPTGGGTVAVSDQRGSVSAWYFGHAT